MISVVFIFVLLTTCRASCLNSDVLFLVTDYLTIGDLLVLSKVGGMFRDPVKRRTNVVLRKRMNPDLRRAFREASVSGMLKLLNVFKLQYRITFNSLARTAFGNPNSMATELLCDFYQKYNLHFKDPYKSHEQYRREDMLRGLVINFENYYACRAILKLLKFSSMDEALFYFQTYKRFLPAETRVLIDRLQYLHDNYQIEVMKAQILARIK